MSTDELEVKEIFLAAFSQLKFENNENCLSAAERFLQEGKFKEAFICYYNTKNGDEMGSDVTDFYIHDLAVNYMQNQEYNLAFAYAWAAHETGYLHSAELLGFLYENQHCSFMSDYSQSMQKAYDLYKKATSVSAMAKFRLASMCYRGTGPNEIDDLVEAKYWASQAAKEDILDAHVLLGQINYDAAKALMNSIDKNEIEQRKRLLNDAKKHFMQGHQLQNLYSTIQLARMYIYKDITETNKRIVTINDYIVDTDAKAMTLLNAPHCEQNQEILYLKGIMALEQRDGQPICDHLIRAIDFFTASHSFLGTYKIGEIFESTCEYEVAANWYAKAYELKKQTVIDSFVNPKESKNTYHLANAPCRYNPYQKPTDKKENNEALMAKYDQALNYLTQEDFANAYRLFKHVANYGLPGAGYYQALLLAEGKGVMADTAGAYQLMLNIAKKHRDPRAQFQIAIWSLIPQHENSFCNYNVDRAIEYLKDAANQPAIKFNLIPQNQTKLGENSLFHKQARNYYTLQDIHDGTLSNRRNEQKPTFPTGGHILGSLPSITDEEISINFQF